MTKKELDARGLAAARRYAQWHIGDPNWADSILAAYVDPEGTIADLDREADNSC
jgi:hypothetical protein